MNFKEFMWTVAAFVVAEIIVSRLIHHSVHIVGVSPGAVPPPPLDDDSDSDNGSGADDGPIVAPPAPRVPPGAMPMSGPNKYQPTPPIISYPQATVDDSATAPVTSPLNRPDPGMA